MKFLLDQGLPRSTVAELSNRGIDAEHVSVLGMSKATDEEILEEARDLEKIIVTLDADFHAILATTSAVSPSVIRIRIEGLKGDDIADIVEKVIASAQAELEAGAAVTVTKTQLRARFLPLV